MPEIGIALAVRGDAQEQRRMATLQVNQPLAHKPPKIDASPASSSR